MNSAELRKKIQEVRSDPNLTALEKSSLVQSLLNSQYCSEVKVQDSKEPLDNTSTSCAHYVKNCSRFKFSCCGLIDPCHRCHYARESCSVKPPQIESIICNICETVQTPSHTYV